MLEVYCIMIYGLLREQRTVYLQLRYVQSVVPSYIFDPSPSLTHNFLSLPSFNVVTYPVGINA